MFFAGGTSGEDAPIVLGPPTTDYGDFAAAGSGTDYGDFAAPPAVDYGDYSAPPTGSGDGGDVAYLGDVNEAAMLGSSEEPIVLLGDESALVASSNSEPTPMQIWNTEWQATIATRKEEENTRKAELAEEARVALEAFQAEREQRREAAMAKNREEEQVKLEAIEADLENDNSWQRVCKIVELQHESTEKSQDVKRMRDVMIYLKNEPTKAATLSA